MRHTIKYKFTSNIIKNNYSNHHNKVFAIIVEKKLKWLVFSSTKILNFHLTIY